LKQQAPQIVFDAAKLNSEEDWVRAGELVFDTPNAFSGVDDFYEVRNPAFFQAVQAKLGPDGTLPYLVYVVREKGKIEVGRNGCGTCHTRVLRDGRVIKGAQGNWPFDRAQAFAMRDRTVGVGALERQLFATPWIKPDPNSVDAMSNDEILVHYAAIPPGVVARQGTSLYHPSQVPDLIGLKDRKYLDHTGFVRQRSIGDLMRYATLNQGTDLVDSFGGFIPAASGGHKTVPLPESLRPRYSDAQLYALAMYLYSLKPPANPNRLDESAERGRRVFEREGCAGCHPAPLYTNNKLTPAHGFKLPQEDIGNSDVMTVSVDTDSFLATKTRRGTGYYKVPSLRGVWYRGPFGHDGSVATLEDWFDPNRLKDEYVPTAFKGAGVSHRAVPGHRFGLALSGMDKSDLIGFLKTV
jgi:hypothetical protein